MVGTSLIHIAVNILSVILIYKVLSLCVN